MQMKTNLWGKKKEKEGQYFWLPLEQHLLDTSNLMIQLWNHWLSEGQRKFILESISASEEEAGISLAAFVGLAHDLGKATPSFSLRPSGNNQSTDLDKILTERLIRAGFAELGMRLFYFFRPIYEINKDFDASCCVILFCKAMELQMKGCFKEGIQQALPDYEIKGQGKGRARVKLKDAQPNELTLGTFQYAINKNIPELSRRMKLLRASIYDEKWWNEFYKKLVSCTDKRNKCCHDGLFEWKHLSQLLADMFMESGNWPKIAGLMFESQIGEKLKATLCIADDGSKEKP